MILQKEVAEEIAARTRLERSRQDEVRSGTNRRRSTAPSLPSQMPSSAPSGITGSSSNTSNAPTTPSSSSKASSRPKRNQRQHTSPSSGNPSRNKKEKVYCICRTPYDETKFYVGCDLCNNWFHGDCVGITEESSKTMTEFICSECKHARDTQEIFCLCRQPYDESQ